MFIEIDEMKSVLYAYQMEDIAEGDETILYEGIAAGVEEVKAYFMAANNRRNNGENSKQQYQSWVEYDIAAIFGAIGSDRNAFVLRLCKTVAAYNICELANTDILYEQVKERYENVVKTLERIAGYGDSQHIPLVISNLPTIPPPSEGTNLPFRFGSRLKFTHDF